MFVLIHGQVVLSRFSSISSNSFEWIWIVQFHKISILPPWKVFLFCTPSPPSENSSLASHFASKILTFKTPLHSPYEFPVTFHGVGMDIFWNCRLYRGKPPVADDVQYLSSQNLLLFFCLFTVFLTKSCWVFLKETLKASDTLEHQPTARPVPYACAQTYHPGSGSHGQLFRPC